MAQLSQPDRETLINFLTTILGQVESGKLKAGIAFEHIMHPLDAWNNGNSQEFIPWIRLWLEDEGRI